MCGDAHTITGAADGAFEDVRSAKLLADLLGRNGLIAEREHFRAGKNFQLLDFRKLGDDIFRNAVAEVFVFFGTTLIFEVEDGD